MSRRPRILITRTRHQASVLAEQLQAAGAETIVIPTIQLAPPTSYEALDFGLANLENGFDWLVFTSANAVNAFAERKREKGITSQPRRIAVIGSATARALAEVELVSRMGSVLMPDDYVAESLVQALLREATAAGQRYLLVRAEEARDKIPASLEAAGHTVFIAPAYRNVTPPDAISALQQLFDSVETQPDVITFTSSSTARNLFALMEVAGIALPPMVAIASIGPITSATLRELGHVPDYEAAEATIEALVDIVKAACLGGAGGRKADSLRE